jgi:PAS domain S-box-containing protein
MQICIAKKKVNMHQNKMPTGKTSNTGELRRQAEAKFIERKNKTGPLPELASEARRLVHELQVHKIELEMQNEELIQARAELEASLDQYTNLYDFAPVGYFTLARDGQIQKANLAGAKLLGSDRSNMISRQFGQFVAFDSRSIFSTFLNNLFSREGENREVCELLLQREGAAAHWVYIEATTDASQSETCRLAAIDITERKQAEDQLRFQATMLNAVQQAVVATDTAGTITWMNHAAEGLYGWPKEEALGRNILDVTVPQFSQAQAKEILTRLTKGESWSGEFPAQHRDGTIFPAQVNNSVIYNAEGELVGIIGISSDITERKQAQDEVRRLKDFDETLINNMGEGIMVQDTEGTFTFVNPAAIEITGYSQGELLGQHWTNLIPADQHDIIEQADTLRPSGASSRYEIDFIHKNGERINLLVSGSPLIENDVFNGTMAVFLDITERRQAQEEIARAYQLLEDTGRLGKIGGWALELNTMELYFSAETFRIYELPGPTPPNLEDAINFYAPESRPIIRLAVQNAIEKHISYNLELPFITAKGQNIWVRAQGNVEVKDSQAVRLYGSFQDITGHKMAEKIIQNHAAELENRVEERTIELTHANRTKDEFLATMSHELRTPLNSILGFSESLLEQGRGPLNEKQEQYIGLIYSSGEHLLGLINDILEVSKIEAGKLDLRPDIISVKEVCESSLNFIKEMAIKKAISIEFKNETSALTLRADPKRLKQILVNLLNNAVKFTPERGRVLLEVKISPEKDRIQFSVEDNGNGITKENLSKLFVPFTQLDSGLSRHYEGTGLGLVLVLKFTEIHGGSVQVESEPGLGSRFTVALPWNEDQKSNPNQALNSAKPVETSPSAISNTGERGKVLLAEDSKSNVLTVQEYLSDNGYEVAVAQNGLEAIAMAEQISPDIILMDIQMPKMDGLEAIRRLRAATKSVSVPIIAVTALAMPGDRERCLEAGANEYISKPVSLKGLVKTINTLLAKEA